MAESGQSNQMSDSVLKSSDVLFDLFCEVCSEDGKHAQAEGFCVDCSDYLCDGCYKIHRKTRATRNHVLQDRSTMPQKKPALQQRPVPSAPKDSCTEPCEYHPEETVKYFCRDHKILGCSACMTVKHRVCEGVEYIQDIAAGLLTSQEYKLFQEELIILDTTSKRIMETSKANITKADKYCTDVHKYIQILRNDLIKAFDKFEIAMNNKAEKQKLADVQSMKVISDKGEQVQSSVEKILSDVQIFKKNFQLCQLFITMTRSREKFGSLQHTLQEAEEANTVQAYTFSPSAEIQAMIKSPASWGDITMQTTKGQTPSRQPPDTEPSAPFVPKPVSAMHQNDIKVRTKVDRSECMISGCALLPDNRLVLTDWNNGKVKLVNLQKQLVSSELKTLKQCWDLTPTTADQIAVTLPSDKKILFIKVTDKLTVDRELTVSGECRGIAYTNNKLFVSFENPGKVEIMALDGAVERMLENDDSGAPLFSWPLYLSPSPDCHTVSVSDSKKHSITRITLDGTVVGEYRDQKLSRPCGIVLDKFGRVIACDPTSGDIRLLQPDCTLTKVLVSGLEKPGSLFYSRHTDQLYVGQYSDIVKVYQLSQ